MAAEADTRALVLTHFSNCIEDPKEHEHLAQEVFPATQVAEELMTMTLRFEQEV